MCTHVPGHRTRSSFLSLCCFQITKVPENLLPFAVQCRNLTVSNTRTVLLTPEIYVDQNIHEQLVDLMLEAIQGAREYISKTCELLHFDSKFKIPLIALKASEPLWFQYKLRKRAHTLTFGDEYQDYQKYSESKEPVCKGI